MKLRSKKTFNLFLAGLFMVLFIGNQMGISVQAADYNLVDFRLGKIVAPTDSLLHDTSDGTTEIYLKNASGSYDLKVTLNTTTAMPFSSIADYDLQLISYQMGSTNVFRFARYVKEEKKEEQVSIYTCNHSYVWEVANEATEEADGTLVYQCEKCGQIAKHQQGGTGTTSAYAVFNEKALEKIMQAQEGDTVYIDTKLWTSFPQAVMEGIAARRDITLELTYQYEGVQYRIAIPAGAEVKADVPFAGFHGYLAGLYGKAEIN